MDCVFKFSHSVIYGGVFYFYNGGNILISNCIFEKNYAAKGGAIYFNFDDNIKGYNFLNCILFLYG